MPSFATKASRSKKPEFNASGNFKNLDVTYDTANPYGPFDGSKSIDTTIGADSGSSPETYNRANHLHQQVGLVTNGSSIKRT